MILRHQAVREHIGYIIDRDGFPGIQKVGPKDVNLPEETIENKNVYWGGPKYY